MNPKKKCSHAPGRTALHAMYNQCREDAVVYDAHAQGFCAKHKRYAGKGVTLHPIETFPQHVKPEIRKYFGGNGDA